jgi:GR25 family glycosyltransferase involved in LPS biosynthesis
MTVAHAQIPVFLVSSVHETARKPFVELLRKEFPNLEQVEAIYPSHTRVPFLQQLQERSEERTGRSLKEGEIGLILTNRKIWRKILNRASSDEEHFLILESDSKISESQLLHKNFNSLSASYDIFFWGAWFGHMRLLRSKRKTFAVGYSAGEPLINSVACTYGYSINRKAAAVLLKATARIAYPVDEFKRYLAPGQLRFGGVAPELISVHPSPSTIRQDGSSLKEKIWILLLDLRNHILSFCR